MILAAIGPVASFIGSQLFPISVMGSTFRMPIAAALVSSILGYVLSLVGVYVVALIVDALAPTFGGQKDRLKAMKVTVYSWTAAWVAGVFGLVPALAILSIVGLYSLYLLYLGLPVLMRAPKEKALAYTAVASLCGIGVFIVIAIISGAVTGPLIAGSMTSSGIVYP